MLKRLFFSASVAVASWVLMAFVAYNLTSVMDKIDGVFWVMSAVLVVVSVAIAMVVNLILKMQGERQHIVGERKKG